MADRFVKTMQSMQRILKVGDMKLEFKTLGGQVITLEVTDSAFLKMIVQSEEGIQSNYIEVAMSEDDVRKLGYGLEMFR